MTWLVWWIASLRLLPFGRAALWVLVALVAPAPWRSSFARGELVAWVAVDCASARWSTRPSSGSSSRLALFVRWSNPDLWHPTLGGEKPMDFAYLNAVVKTTSFPPYDPWFAGGFINYYYYGFVLVAGAEADGDPAGHRL